MRHKTWKVVKWDKKQDGVLPLSCPKCGTEADMPTHGSAFVIASIGLGIVLDPPGTVPPDGFMPDEVKCRYCRTTWVS